MTELTLRVLLGDLHEQSAPAGSLAGTPASAYWLPPRLRLLPSGDGFVVAGSALLRLVGGTVVDSLPYGRVTDALPSGDGAWVLSGRSLRRLPSGSAGPEGAWERLLADATTVYAVARRPSTVLAALPGGVVRDLGARGLDPVVSPSGEIAWVDGSRGWNVLGVDGDARRVPLAPGAEGVPIGVDAAGRGYLARATGVTVIEPDGTIAWSFGADGIVLDGSRVITSHDVEFSPPDVGRAVAWRLIGPGLWWGGDGGAGVLASVAETGEVLAVSDPAPEDARLRGWWPAAARDWAVTADGGVHFTVGGPDGVAVVTLRG